MTPQALRPTIPLARPGAIRLVSCYELGHQPIGVASARAFLERAGFRPETVDLAVEPVERITEGQAALVAFAVPMHTALHVGVRAASRVRRRWPDAHVCFFGLYATLNAGFLLGAVADSVIGGEFEQPLTDLARAIADGRSLHEVAGLGLRNRPAAPHLERLHFAPPARDGLPPIERYARLVWGDAERPAAAIEASRGCLHRCRHCPIPPVYGGRFFVVPRDVVLEDVRRVAESGARHLTFADPDFFNGPGHVLAIVDEIHRRFPGMTFDVTTKVENVLRHRRQLDRLRARGCVFVVSAVESLSDRVLERLDKGHSRRDAFEALRWLREAGIAWRPTFVPFTPWTTLEDYLELLDWIDGEDLIGNVDPVQLSIRLLVPPGSLLAGSESMRPHLRGLLPERFSHVWSHPDPRLDRLQERVAGIVRDAAVAGRSAPGTFAAIREAARETAGLPSVPSPTRGLPAREAAAPPRLTEPWFC